MSGTTDKNEVIEEVNGENQQEVDEKKSDGVSYETYKRVLAETKKFKEQARELKTKIEELESKKEVDDSGDAIKKLKDQIESERKKSLEIEKELAARTFKHSFESIAKEAGCIDIKGLMAHIDDDELKLITEKVDSKTVKVDEEYLKTLIAEKKEKVKHFFKNEEKREDQQKQKPSVKTDFKGVSYAELLKIVSQKS